MTPTELKVRALKKMESAITKYMDGKINDVQFSDMCIDFINEFIADFGDL